ncbi:MAG: homocysteine S-methyltransferase family protein, partial [Lachnospiraceae bacterium]|nr:homocysteine S-methyltransferase family protein [Lachnospiraceae bacterium]
MIILDGGMGTMLQAAGIPLGERPEIYGAKHPEIIEDIQRRYVEAGSTVIYANTFGANAHKLKGTGYSPEELIEANIKTALRAAAGKARVAMDIGPIGELLEPIGSLKFEDAYELFAQMAAAGEAAGAELIIIETMTDLYEVKAAVLAAKEHTNLPVWVTMSFEKNGRTFTGTTIASMAAMLNGLKVDAMGINCSLGPVEILPLIKELSEWTDIPIIVKPNAGLPDPDTGEYRMDAEDFAEAMKAFYPLGIGMAGGCCGTDPSYIKGVAEGAKAFAAGRLGERAGEWLKGSPGAGAESKPLRKGICSANVMCEYGGIKVIGERINPTGKKLLKKALLEGDMDYIMEKAIEQADAGADILDINVGLPDIDEPRMMREVVKAVQSVTDLPLMIDSTDPAAIEAGLRAACGKAIVNSVNAEKESL